MDKPSFYAVIPATVRYAPISAGAKLLYGEITALTHSYGYCSAHNEYFMRLYKKTDRTIQAWIDQLVQYGFVERVIFGNRRELRDVVPIHKIGVFEPPTVEEVRAYCQEHNLNVDADLFVRFYSSKGWKIGKNMMQDWKASVQVWAQRVNQTASTSQSRARYVGKGVNGLVCVDKAYIGGSDMERRKMTDEEINALFTKLDDEEDV